LVTYVEVNHIVRSQAWPHHEFLRIALLGWMSDVRVIVERRKVHGVL
jgi:hypothetical protein